MPNLPAPRYTLWQAITAALALSQRAIEEVRALSRQPGPQGECGPPGPPALGFDDLEVKYDGERTFVFRFACGDRVKEFPFSIPCVLDRGVWKEGEAYKKGDAVTWDGSWHIAQADTDERPVLSRDWRIGAKKGGNGSSVYEVARKNGFKGTEKEWLASLKGDPGPEGKSGRDLTQRGPDGSKW